MVRAFKEIRHFVDSWHGHREESSEAPSKRVEVGEWGGGWGGGDESESIRVTTITMAANDSKYVIQC